MAAILTAAEMRALERAAIERGEVTGLELMERAGRGVVEAILAEWPGIEEGARRAVVLCGPGNNGGDGFVVARLLKERGWQINVLAMAEPEAMPQDAATAARRWHVARGRTLAMTETALRRDVKDADVYVDALFGIGLTRPLEGEAASVVGYLAGSGGDWGHFSQRVVSVDVPSGLDADSGTVPGCPEPDPFRSGAPYARLTVTFDSPKPGHFLAHGPSLCGKLAVADIGLGHLRHAWLGNAVPELRARSDVRRPSLQRVDASAIRNETLIGHGRAFNRIAKQGGHKYDHGHAVVLAGGCGKGGAARMAARGALRVGAGLVTLVVPPAALQENATRLDAIMLRSVKDADTLGDALKDARLNALCAGPGLGTDDREAALLATLLGLKRPTVVDADALSLLAQREDLRPMLHDKVVLTPHEGEFARLVPDLAERLAGPKRPEGLRRAGFTPEAARRAFAEAQAYRDALAAETGPAFSKVDAAREAAARLGCVVLLKGPDTVIADPTGRAAINAAVYDRAAPWLATAGSGDVLAGFITGLLARGFAPFDAACTAAWLHVECALSFGPGLIAEDLPEELPKVFRALGL